MRKIEKTVKTIKELKSAIENKDEIIIIADENLSKNIKLLKDTEKIALCAGLMIVFGLGLDLISSILNPIKLGGRIFSLPLMAKTATVSPSLLITLTALYILGAVVLISLYKDYDIEIYGESHSCKGGIKLRKKTKV